MLRKKLKLMPLVDNLDAQTNYNISPNADESSLAPSTSVDVTKSKYFEGNDAETFAATLLQYERDLNDALQNLTFKEPVRYVYNPVEYAYTPHSLYVEKYCQNEKKLLLLGMNPGPWGMCQTGVPFGEVNLVRDWFKVTGPVSKPEKECPGKAIVGFECHRSEESGKRLIGFFKKTCGTPDTFFKNAFLHNYCPLAFMSATGANVTPSGLKGQVRQELENLCNATLFKIIKLLKPEVIVGIGRYAEGQVKQILQKNDVKSIRIVYMPHPSPRVVNNENWPEKAEKVLNDFDLVRYFQA